MSLPGLDLMQPSADNQFVSAPPTQISLSKGSEWRFEVAFGTVIRVKVSSSTKYTIRYQSLGVTSRLTCPSSPIGGSIVAPSRHCRTLWNRTCPIPDIHVLRNKGRNIHVAWLYTGSRRGGHRTSRRWIGARWHERRTISRLRRGRLSKRVHGGGNADG
jgi:hypothetical protein